jgi:hypothetical protein
MDSGIGSPAQQCQDWHYYKSLHLSIIEADGCHSFSLPALYSRQAEREAALAASTVLYQEKKTSGNGLEVNCPS